MNLKDAMAEVSGVLDFAKECGIRLSSENITSLICTVYISGQKNGGNGTGNFQKTVPSTENVKLENYPATTAQLGFLKKYGGKNIILVGITKNKASEMISRIKEGWNSKK